MVADRVGLSHCAVVRLEDKTPSPLPSPIRWAREFLELSGRYRLILETSFTSVMRMRLSTALHMS